MFRRTATVSVLILTGFLAGLWVATPRTSAAPDDKIKNLEAHLEKDAEFQDGDLETRLAILHKLSKARKINGDQARWMQVRELEQAARKQELVSDLPKLMAWLAEMKNYKHPISKTARSGLGEMIALYGSRRLYQDETYVKGDTIAKLKRVNELFKARELDQSFCYELNRTHVYRYLAPAKGDIEKELELLGKLNAEDAINWAAGGWIEAGLAWRAVNEIEALDSFEKKASFLVDLMKKETLSWMTTSKVLPTLAVIHCEQDADFLALDAEGRKARIEEWKSQGLISRWEAGKLLAAYASVR